MVLASTSSSFWMSFKRSRTPSIDSSLCSGSETRPRRTVLSTIYSARQRGYSGCGITYDDSTRPCKALRFDEIVGVVGLVCVNKDEIEFVLRRKQLQGVQGRPFDDLHLVSDTGNLKVLLGDLGQSLLKLRYIMKSTLLTRTCSGSSSSATTSPSAGKARANQMAE